MRVISDLDRTILAGWDEGYEPQPAPWLDKILSLGEVVAIVTNQGGIAWNLAGGRPGKKYPSWPSVAERVRAGMRLTNARMAFVSLYHPSARVPSLTDSVLWKRNEEVGLPFVALVALGCPEAHIGLKVKEGTIFVSWSPKWRKPSPGALLFAQKLLRIAPQELCYVGDEDSDREAAEAAGMRFVDVREWQNDKGPSQ